MRLPRILSRYVLREVAVYGLVGFLAFATILVTQNLLRPLEDLLALGFTQHDFLVSLVCLGGMFGAYAAPVAFLFCVLLAMGRLSSNSEVTAMQASGLGLQRRIALPVAPLLFALVGVPLGLRRTRGARSWGALLCIVVVFGYYALLSLSQFLGGGGVLSPVVALWLPNLAFATLAAFLLGRARHRSI